MHLFPLGSRYPNFPFEPDGIHRRIKMFATAKRHLSGKLHGDVQSFIYLGHIFALVRKIHSVRILPLPTPVYLILTQICILPFQPILKDSVGILRLLFHVSVYFPTQFSQGCRFPFNKRIRKDVW